jgi:hypothetical protein
MATLVPSCSLMLFHDILLMQLIIQAITGERSFILLLPKDFAAKLAVGKGDYLKCEIEGNNMMVEKLEPLER